MTATEQCRSTDATISATKRAEDHRTNAVVFVLLTRKNGDKHELLFQQRINTSYMSDMYDFSASGKVERGAKESAKEAAVREAFEEIEVIIDPRDLRFFHVRDETKEKHLKLFFWTDKWMVDGVENGDPRIGEPNKCGGLCWTTYDNLPEALIPFLRKVLYYGFLRMPYSDDLHDTTPKEFDKKMKQVVDAES